MRNGQWSQLRLTSVLGQLYYAAMPPLTSAHEAASHIDASHAGHGMKATAQALALTPYLHVRSGTELSAGSALHARELAGFFSGRPTTDIVSVEKIVTLGGDYGFAYKRVPVWKVQYADSMHSAYYIELATQVLTLKLEDVNRWQDTLFGLLHKFHWMDWAGQNARDVVLSSVGLLHVLVALLGLRLFLRRWV